MRHEVRLHLGHEVHDNHNHDQQRGPTKVERHVGCDHKKLRQQADSRHVQGAEHGQAGQHAIDIASRLLTVTNPGINAPDFFRFSATSFGLNINAV